MGKKSSLSAARIAFSAVIAAGALLGILSVFLLWTRYPDWYSIPGYTGWEVFTGDVVSYLIGWMPGVVLFFSIIALAGAVASVITARAKRGDIAILAGVVIFVAVIIFTVDVGISTQTYYVMDVVTYELIPTEADPSIGTGVIFAAIAGILIAVFGGLAAVFKEKESRSPEERTE